MNKICFFNSTKAWGGGEKWHFEMALELHRQGYEILFISGKGSALNQKLTGTGIPFHTFKIKNLSFLNFFLINRLKKLFVQKKIDTIITNLSIDLKVAGIAAKRAGVKRIIYRRGSAIPIKNKLLNRYLFRNVITDIIANSTATKNTILEKNERLFPLEKIKVIYNGLNFNTENTQNKSPLYSRKNNEIILGHAGRMVYQKGHEYLIEVAAKLKQKGNRFKLLLAGTGPLESNIRQQVKHFGLEEEVIFLGFVEDITQFMHSIDIFLLTSRWEGFGFVLAEAMAAGKPLVAFDISSNPELVRNEINGFLVSPFDTDEFTDKTYRLIRDQNLLKKMGEKGRAIAHSEFSFERTVKELKDMLFTK